PALRNHESSFELVIEPEFEGSRGALRYRALGEGECAGGRPLGHARDDLQPALEILLSLATLREQQPIAVGVGLALALDLELRDADAFRKGTRRHDLAQEPEVLLERTVLLLQLRDAARQLDLRCLSDRQLP